MRNLILAIAMLSTTAAFSQKDCKCYENDYKVYGELTHKEVKNDVMFTEYYAGINEGYIQFSELKYRGDKVDKIWISTFPIAEVNLSMNNPFSSRSKTTDGDGYTELSLGGNLGGANSGKQIYDMCIPVSSSMSPNKLKRVSNTGFISGKFTSKEKLVEFTDKVKGMQ